MGKLVNRIPGSRLLYQVYRARLRECMLNRSASLAMSTSNLEALPGKLDIKRQPSILYIRVPIQQAHYYAKTTSFRL